MSIFFSYSGFDDLLWALMQYISGSISKNTALEFAPVLRLVMMYAERLEQDAARLPDVSDPSCVKKFAAASLFILLTRKTQQENVS